MSVGIDDYIASTGATAEDLARLVVSELPEPPIDTKAAMHEVAAAGMEGPRELEDYNNTDAGNGLRLAARYGQDHRYNWDTRRFLSWSGRVWVPDGDLGINQAAIQLAKDLYARAGQLIAEDAVVALGSGTSRNYVAQKGKELTTWAQTSESRPRIDAMIKSVRAGVPIFTKDLDTHPLLLNTPSGTVDLETGTLRLHRREDYLTRITNAAYEPGLVPGGGGPWREFLDLAIPTVEVQEYVQVVAGASIGAGGLDTIIFIVGRGRTGKTTFTEGIRRALGAYAVSTQLSTFSSSKENKSSNSALARTRGARLVLIPEAEEGLGVARLLKSVTGLDSIDARDLYESSGEFVPRYSIWARMNKLPRLPHDEALLARIRVIRFETRFDQLPNGADASVRDRLANPDHPKYAGADILGWLVAGYRKFIAEYGGHLPKPPEEIAEATAQYGTLLDPLEGFIGEAAVAGNGTWTPRAAVYDSYVRWSGKGVPLSRSEFYQRLLELDGVQEAGRNGTRGFKGIGLLDTTHAFGK